MISFALADPATLTVLEVVMIGAAVLSARAKAESAFAAALFGDDGAALDRYLVLADVRDATEAALKDLLKDILHFDFWNTTRTYSACVNGRRVVVRCKAGRIEVCYA